MLSYPLEFPSFLRPDNIPLYVNATFRLSIRLLTDVCIVCLLAIGNNVAMHNSVRVKPLLEGSGPPLQP